jgi:transcriptional regulator with XRE-family HTH domain
VEAGSATGGGTTARGPGGPTVPRILLGTRLRRFREERRIARATAADAIRASDSKISRMELGRSPFKVRDVEDLLTLYGITGEHERASLILLAQESNRPAWWNGYSDLISAGTEHYLGLEVATSLLRVYEPRLVPELLQTRDYARAVIKLRQPRPSDLDAERWVDLRIERQELFLKSGGRKLWALLDEAVLHRAWGGPKIMRGQLERLLELSASPEVTLQIVPFTAVSTMGLGSAYSLFRFAEDDLPDVVHLNQATGEYYMDKQEDVDRFAQEWGLLSGDALEPAESQSLLHRMLTRP